jgi:hypothetical protein
MQLVGDSDRRSDGTSALNAGVRISGGECTACREDPPLSVVGPSPLKWYATSASPLTRPDTALTSKIGENDSSSVSLPSASDSNSLARMPGLKHIDFFKSGWLCEQLRMSFRRHRSAGRKEGSPVFLICEGGKSTIGRGTEAERKPPGGCGLLFDDCKAFFEEALDLTFQSGMGIKSGEYSHGGHLLVLLNSPRGWKVDDLPHGNPSVMGLLDAIWPCERQAAELVGARRTPGGWRPGGRKYVPKYQGPEPW